MTIIERIDMVNLLKSASKSEKKANSGKGATSEKGAALEKTEPVEDQPAEPAPKANGSQPEIDQTTNANRDDRDGQSN